MSQEQSAVGCNMIEEDKNLLELAAKAAGLPDHFEGMVSSTKDDPLHVWNPLKDDGDALRLAVKLRMVVSLANCMCCAVVDWHDNEDDNEVYVRFSESFKDRECDNAEAATRRAIVRAAAEIGKITR